MIYIRIGGGQSCIGPSIVGIRLVIQDSTFGATDGCFLGVCSQTFPSLRAPL